MTRWSVSNWLSTASGTRSLWCASTLNITHVERRNSALSEGSSNSPFTPSVAGCGSTKPPLPSGKGQSGHGRQGPQSKALAQLHGASQDLSTRPHPRRSNPRRPPSGRIVSLPQSPQRHSGRRRPLSCVGGSRKLLSKPPRQPRPPAISTRS